MDVRNRMADVVKLRCNACQDFLRMILKTGWQQLLYNKAQYEVFNKTRYKDKYVATYEKMRDGGVDNYSVDDMDVTLITELVIAKFNGMDAVQKSTKDALIKLKDDRNLTDHSNENEEPDELYLRGLLALCNLRFFIRTVDKDEVTISDNDRLSYRQKYIVEIDSLKSILDEERIELIQCNKAIDRDIQRVLDSIDPQKTWLDIDKIYTDRYWKLEKNPQKYYNFIVRASDAGIPYAHYDAVSYFHLFIKDYTELERRLIMLYHSKPNLSKFEVKHIITAINALIKNGYEMTSGLNEIINSFLKKGYKIEKTSDGFYQIPKK